ncbi:MAG: prephenate dehydratase [Nevskiaceae bacterium]|nr:MAG: prephenate dehydratase [Nevskiaceae bacterium]TBR74781.1 MAG: prephenate dehydratase [Nevskiaceae bacterium]
MTQPSEDPQAALAAARDRIDALDAQLQKLIAERATIANEVRHIKERGGATGDHYRPSREVQVLQKAMARNRELGGPLPDAVMARLVREIMSACLALESPLVVAYFGPPGTYTQAATFKHFGRGVEARAEATIDDVFRAVEAGTAAYGVVPVENSTEGAVNHTLDRLGFTPLGICGEVWLPIHHCLLSRAARLEDVRTVYAHAQSLAQCRNWLNTHLPFAAREVVASNGWAARHVAETADASGAAIASAMAGELYQLPTLAVNIEDDPNNTTRFLVIGHKEPMPTGHDKTSLVLEPQKNQPGALFRLLQPFAEESVDMMRIESRPSRRGLWNYNFFIDLDGHQLDARVQRALDRIRPQAAFFKILGSYPKAVF